MLRVGLTGGIGSGKSTAARRLAVLGAVLVDSDVLAREVVAPGTDALAEVVAAFGRDVLDPDGALDRPALAGVVFGDGRARERLNAIVHPRVRARAEELAAAAAPDAVVVQDVPLLVETGVADTFALVVVVHADAAARERRLVARGSTAADARARIAAQADDAARRAAADVWLDNDGAPAALHAAVDALWHRRLVPFEANLRAGRPVPPPPGGPVAADPGWAAAGLRVAARVARAAGPAGRGAAHVGPTAVPGVPADDVLDVQLGVAAGATPRAAEALTAAGFPRAGDGARGAGTRGEGAQEGGAQGEGAQGEGEPHAGADPGRPVRVHLRTVGSAAWRAALLERDWLRADAPARAERARSAGWDARTAVTRAEDWAATSGWTPSLRA